MLYAYIPKKKNKTKDSNLDNLDVIIFKENIIIPF